MTSFKDVVGDAIESASAFSAEHWLVLNGFLPPNYSHDRSRLEEIIARVDRLEKGCGITSIEFNARRMARLALAVRPEPIPVRSDEPGVTV